MQNSGEPEVRPAASHLQLVDKLLREGGVVGVLAGRARTQHGVLGILRIARHVHTGETAVLRNGAGHVERLLLQILGEILRLLEILREILRLLLQRLLVERLAEVLREVLRLLLQRLGQILRLALDVLLQTLARLT